MSTAHRLLAGALAAGALLTGCAQSVDPIERLGRKAAQKVGPHEPARASVLGRTVRARLPNGGQPREICDRQELLLSHRQERDSTVARMGDAP